MAPCTFNSFGPFPSPILQCPTFRNFSSFSPKKISFFVRSLKSDDDRDENEEPKRSNRLSEQSSWEAKDSEGGDYLYRLGKEADNMNIAVGARAGVIDDLFAGNFLGKDSDIVFDYRQKVTRSFEYLQGDYYIAPVFMVSSLIFLLNAGVFSLCECFSNARIFVLYLSAMLFDMCPATVVISPCL
ncbi:hypothetical protein L1049_004737 [Liquidambar formosana]|uniref:Uncharacterized protein n=1 Tax=Liquidambar formosana TaxID=63359 RepID=A0AAP0WYH0_LIQFO